MKVDRLESFKRDYRALPKEAQKTAAKQIVQLLMDHSHPSLRLEGIKGRKGFFSVRVNDRYRISLTFGEDSSIMLRRILDHDDLYHSP